MEPERRAKEEARIAREKVRRRRKTTHRLGALATRVIAIL